MALGVLALGPLLSVVAVSGHHIHTAAVVVVKAVQAGSQTVYYIALVVDTSVSVPGHQPVALKHNPHTERLMVADQILPGKAEIGCLQSSPGTVNQEENL